MVLGYGGHLVLDGQLELGELVAFNAYVVLLVWPLRMLGLDRGHGRSGPRPRPSGSTRCCVTEPDVVDPPSAASGCPPTGGDGALRRRHVRRTAAGAGRCSTGFDLNVPAGQSVALVGATGSGKSTVAKLIPRFYDVDARRRAASTASTCATSPCAELRRAVGLVFEETFLFSDTIAANIAFADPDAPIEAIERAARLAGAHEFISELPEGYDTEIGERGFSLRAASGSASPSPGRSSPTPGC